MDTTGNPPSREILRERFAVLRQQIQAGSLDPAQLESAVNSLSGLLDEIERSADWDAHQSAELTRLLHEQQSQYAALFDCNPDAILAVDSGGRIEVANRRALEMFGYTSEELIGRPVNALVPAAFRHNHQALVQAYLRKPVLRPMGKVTSLMGITKDGVEIPVDISLGPVYSGGSLKILAVIRDVTQQKQMQSELLEVQRRLLENSEQERLLLAQDLHDGPLQELEGATFQLVSLRKDLVDENERQRLLDIQENLRTTIQGLRSICGELRPPALAPFGLEKALRSYVNRIQELVPDLDIEMVLMSDRQILAENIRLALFRICQHILMNVVKHAHARHVFIRFAFDDHQVLLDIRDDGRGFEVPQRWIELVRGGHYGLIGAMERAKALGGEVRIDSKPGMGTAVRVTVPFQAAKNQNGNR